MANKPEKTGFLNPQQLLFFEHYLNPELDTFSNVRQSALAAGYAEGSTNKIVEQEWYKGHMRRLSMNIHAEVVLEEMLKMETNGIIRVTPQGDEIVGPVPALVKIKQDSAKFVVERLNKEVWSTRTELTGVEGGPIVTAAAKEKADESINEYLSETNPR